MSQPGAGKKLRVRVASNDAGRAMVQVETWNKDVGWQRNDRYGRSGSINGMKQYAEQVKTMGEKAGYKVIMQKASY